MEIKETKITRILNPTSINLGEYVINPYKGCEFACLYCYVRHNKVTSKEARHWGEYVDIRENAPLLLEKELSQKRPSQVLLGSTTDCFQPVEKKWGITQKVIRILNKNKVQYVILTRSPMIIGSIPILKEGFCKAIYFTINNFNERYKRVLEPRSPSFGKRLEALFRLLDESLPVIPYFSPLLPFISNFQQTFQQLEGIENIEFECLNFNLGNIKSIIEAINSIDPKYGKIYNNMLKDQRIYYQVFKMIKREIEQSASRFHLKQSVFIHNWNAYFQNIYKNK